MAGLMGLAATLPASADLPGLEGDEWLGYFVGFKNKKYQFAITSQGKTTLRVIGEKGEPLNQMMTILVEFLVEETQPDGKSTAKYIKAESLESAQPATNKPQQMVIRGKVTGDAGFEAFVSEDRGVISLGGRLLDPGTLTSPTRFSIRLKVPKAYPYAKAAGNKKEEKEQKKNQEQKKPAEEKKEMEKEEEEREKRGKGGREGKRGAIECRREIINEIDWLICYK